MTGWAVRSGSARGPWLAAGGVVAGLGADLAFDPTSRHVPLCPFHAITGWWCPLCGGLRAGYALAHGQLITALHDDVLVVGLAPLVALYWASWAVATRHGRPRPALARPAVVLVAVLAVIFTVVRNLPALGVLRPVG